MDWLRSRWADGVDLALCGALVSVLFAAGLYQRFLGWKYRWFGILLLAAPGVTFAEHRNVCGLRNVAQVKAVALVDHHKQAVVAQVVNHGYGHAQLAVVDQHAYAYPYYYQVGQGLRIEAIAEKTAEKLTAGLEALIEKKVAERLEAGGIPQAATEPLAAMQQLLTKSCVSCHTAENDPDRLDLTNVSQLSTEQMTDIYQRAYAGNMPKNAPPLTQDEMGIISHALGTLRKF